jgi:iron complex transport system substrate-binding protein
MMRSRHLLLLLILLLGFGSGISHVEGETYVRDVRGRKVRCGSFSRIVSLAPNITEILFFTKAGSLLKGVTRFCNYPAEANLIEKIGGIYDPDVEKIISLDPDIVIATKDGNPRQAVDFLEGAGIPGFVINPRNMEEILAAMENIACLTGAPGDIFKRIDSLRAELKRGNGRREEKKARVLFLVSQRPLIAAGKRTFIDEMIERAGGINVAGRYDLSYPRLGVEDILSLSPDLIFWVPSMGGQSGEGQLDRLRSILKSDAIELIPVDSDIYTRPGPRLFEGMVEMEKIINRPR